MASTIKVQTRCGAMTRKGKACRRVVKQGHCSLHCLDTCAPDRIDKPHKALTSCQYDMSTVFPLEILLLILEAVDDAATYYSLCLSCRAVASLRCSKHTDRMMDRFARLVVCRLKRSVVLTHYKLPNGINHGSYTLVDARGPSYTGGYKHGSKVGEWSRVEKGITTVCTYVDGVLHGPVVQRAESGAIVCTGGHADGALDGSIRCWRDAECFDPESSIAPAFVTTFSRGVKEGPEYCTVSSIPSLVNYVDNRLHGTLDYIVLRGVDVYRVVGEMEHGSRVGVWHCSKNGVSFLRLKGTALELYTRGVWMPVHKRSKVGSRQMNLFRYSSDTVQSQAGVNIRI